MAKKKKPLRRAAKWIALIGASAVVGAYTVRFIDRRLGLGGHAEPPPADELPDAIPNGLGMQALAPMMPVPVAVPHFTFPTTHFQMPAIPTIPAMPTFGGEAPAAQAPVANPGPTASERRAERAARFDELVDRFEEGEFG